MDEACLQRRPGPYAANVCRGTAAFRRFLSGVDLAFLCVATVARSVASQRALCREERPMTILFVVPHCEKYENDHNPVDDVCDDRAICRGVRPAEQSVENTPSTAATNLGIAALCLVSHTWEVMHEERDLR